MVDVAAAWAWAESACWAVACVQGRHTPGTTRCAMSGRGAGGGEGRCLGAAVRVLAMLEGARGRFCMASPNPSVA